MVRKENFGTVNGSSVFRFTIEDGPMSVELLSLGATIRAIRVPDREGKICDVCLGYDTVEEYCTRDGYIGASIGRHANRIGKARFSLNGQEYQLTANEGANQLHGGNVGFDRKLWDYTCGENSVTFMLDAADGEEGFPGNLHVEVTYTLKEGTLTIDYRAVSDMDTVVNLTNHAYFNLAGHDGGVVDDHVLMVCAESYTPTDAENIPTGEIAPVEGTVFDLRSGEKLGDRLYHSDLARTNGYDHNFALTAGAAPAAELWCPRTGIALQVTTTLEGVQIYTAGSLTERDGKNGARYGKGHAVCLETQHFPDAVNHENFISPVLKAGSEYRETTNYRFCVK